MYITVHHSSTCMYIGRHGIFTQFSSVPYIGQLIVDNIAQPSSTIESGFSPVRDDSSTFKVMIKFLFYFKEADIMLPHLRTVPARERTNDADQTLLNR